MIVNLLIRNKADLSLTAIFFSIPDMTLLNRILHKLNPKVPKRALLFIAALVWGYAAQKIIVIGVRLYKISNLHFWHIILISIPVYLLFHYFVFNKIILKHTRRIVNKPNPKHCLFSFFDWKSYLIMAFMITLGISVRKYMLLPANFIAEFYIGLGMAIGTSAIYLLYYGIRYGYSVNKFSNALSL
jgi:hypothetical protein